jgi:hypothetical protein
MSETTEQLTVYEAARKFLGQMILKGSINVMDAYQEYQDLVDAVDAETERRNNERQG